MTIGGIRMVSKEQATTLASKAIEIVEEATQPINDILAEIQKSTDYTSGAIRLSMDQLFAIAIRLPVECGYLQAQINDRVVKQRLQEIVTENKITDSITMLRESKGDARERQRRAESMNDMDVLADEAARQIVQAMQSVIIRADKVYEGIKKVIDAKTREVNFDRKPGYPVGN